MSIHWCVLTISASSTPHFSPCTVLSPSFFFFLSLQICCCRNNRGASALFALASPSDELLLHSLSRLRLRLRYRCSPHGCYRRSKTQRLHAVNHRLNVVRVGCHKRKRDRVAWHQHEHLRLIKHRSAGRHLRYHVQPVELLAPEGVVLISVQHLKACLGRGKRFQSA